MIEVDQSGKIGDTRVPTVLALANCDSYAILIPAIVKRRCLRALREQGKKGTRLYIEWFTVALFLLLRGRIEKVTMVRIDVEYPGYDRAIKEHLLNLFRRGGCYVSSDKIAFGLVGKTSPAHHKALSVYRGHEEPDRIISAREILREFK